MKAILIVLLSYLRIVFSYRNHLASLKLNSKKSVLFSLEDNENYVKATSQYYNKRKCDKKFILVTG